MQLQFLGRGSAFNTKEDNNSAYIKSGGNLLLIDCGGTIFHKLMEKDLLKDVENVSILITHFHPDHVGSLGDLIFYLHYIKNITPTIIYPIKSRIYEFLYAQGITDNLYNYSSMNTTNLSCEVFNYKVYAMNFDHCKEMINYGYMITDISNPHEFILYTGDTRIVDKKVIELLGKSCKIYIDTSISEYDNSVHISLRELENKIDKQYRHQIYCMHLDDSETLPKLIKEKGFNVVEVI